MANLKLTGFGRLILFLAIIAPIVYFGMKYLQNSGTLDKMKEKVEDVRSERPEAKQESESDILGQIDRQSERAAKEKEDMIAEQQRKIEELERRNRELQNRNESPSTSNLPEINIPEPNLDSPASNTSGGSSIFKKSSNKMIDTMSEIVLQMNITRFEAMAI